jgi:hypothetical protein
MAREESFLTAVLEFHPIHEVPTALRGWPPGGHGFMMGGRFRVVLRLNPAMGCPHFEYRQFIRGTCTAQRGHFMGSPASALNWLPDGTEIDRSGVFAIPGGLNASVFHEDGLLVHGVPTRMGYRSAVPTLADGLEDRYLPDQANGCQYVGVDTYGLRDTTRVAGTRIRLHLWFEGRVIDRSHRDTIIETHRWEAHGDDVIVT